MKNLSIDNLLQVRSIARDADTDYFIETTSLPIHFHTSLTYLSRIQFPTSRGILIRTSPLTSVITIHILRDVDLYSSFVNFEVDLSSNTLQVLKKDCTIELWIQ